MKTTVQEIKEKIASAQGLDDDRKQELNQLVDKLYAELDDLAKTDRSRAESVSGFASVSTHEAAKGSNPETLDYALKGFSSSVEQLEVTHPRMVAVVNRICQMFSDIGI